MTPPPQARGAPPSPPTRSSSTGKRRPLVAATLGSAQGSAKSDPGCADTCRWDSGGAALLPRRAGAAAPGRACVSGTERSRTEPSKAELGRAEPSVAECCREQPNRAQPASPAEHCRAWPSGSDWGQKEPSRAERSCVGLHEPRWSSLAPPAGHRAQRGPRDPATVLWDGGMGPTLWRKKLKLQRFLG